MFRCTKSYDVNLTDEAQVKSQLADLQDATGWDGLTALLEEAGQQFDAGELGGTLYLWDLSDGKEDVNPPGYWTDEEPSHTAPEETMKVEWEIVREYFEVDELPE